MSARAHTSVDGAVGTAVAGPEQLAAVLAAGGDDLRALLARTEQRLAEIADGAGNALAPLAADTLRAGGKRLRPMLIFICAGDAVTEPLVSAGVAVELLHMATLVHDDILDRAALRRGRPTVVATAGVDAAVATGDFLFARAFAELTSTGSAAAVRALSSASSALVRGELMQRDDAWSTSVTCERYLERCELKTARLFEAACRLGALLGGPGPSAADALADYGARIGTAFQIFDDVLDVAGPTERTGKLRGTDLLDGTVTLPLIIARSRDAKLAAADLRATVTDAPAAEALCERIAQTGALEQARTDALEYVHDAKASLRDIDLSERQRRTLELVADGVIARYA